MPLTVSTVSAKLVIWFLPSMFIWPKGNQSIVDGEVMKIDSLKGKSAMPFFMLAVFAAGMLAASMAYADDTAASGDDILGVQAGTAPDSIFYGFKKIGERANVAFTFDREEKAKLKYKYAVRRLAEAELMAGKQKSGFAQDALAEYEAELESVQADLNQMALEGKNLTDIEYEIGNGTYRHIFVLERVYQKVPESAKPAIRRAMENSLEMQGRLSETRNTSQRLVNITIIVGNQTVTREVPEKLAEKFLEKAREMKKEFRHELDIENEDEIKSKIAENTAVRAEKASEQISDAREAIAEAEAKIASSPAGNSTTAANRLLQQARDKLNLSEQAFSVGKFGEAFGQAVAAEAHAKSAKRIVERSRNGDVLDEFKIEARISANSTDAKIELKFVTSAKNRSVIASEILGRLNLSQDQIAARIDVSREEDDSEDDSNINVSDRLKAEAKVEPGLTKVEAQYKFSLNVTNETDIAAGIYQKLSQLTLGQIESALKLEIEGRDDKKDGKREEKEDRREEKKNESNRRVCAQVIAPAKNPRTGECREFSTPCDVPEGWKKVDRCLPGDD